VAAADAGWTAHIVKVDKPQPICDQRLGQDDREHSY
jgi:hypothetical protein